MTTSLAREQEKLVDLFIEASCTEKFVADFAVLNPRVNLKRPQDYCHWGCEQSRLVKEEQYTPTPQA